MKPRDYDLFPILGGLNLHATFNEYPRIPASTLRPSSRSTKIRRHPRTVVIDSTSETSLVSLAVAQDCRAAVVEREPRSLQVGIDKEAHISVTHWSYIQLDIDGIAEEVLCAVVKKTLQPDIVLGRDWVELNKPRINWSRRTMILQSVERAFDIVKTYKPPSASRNNELPRAEQDENTHVAGVQSAKRRRTSQDGKMVDLCPEIRPEDGGNVKRLGNSYPCPRCYVDPWDEDADMSYGTGTVCERTNPLGFREDMLFVAPGLACKPCFVVQKHHATAKHFDLRLQACIPGAKNPNGFISFAVPKGFSGLHKHHHRLAVETPRHGGLLHVRQLMLADLLTAVAYSEYEGGPKKPTMLWDAGYYRICRSASSFARNRDSDSPTDEDDQLDQNQCLDWHHMEKLTRKHRKGAFIIELIGTRQRIRLLFKRTGVKYPRHRVYLEDGSQMQSNQTIAHAEWIFQRYSLPGCESDYLDEEDTTFEERSILCGKTINEVKEWANTPEGQKLHRVWLKKHDGYFRDGPDAGYMSDKDDYNALATMREEGPALQLLAKAAAQMTV